LSINAKAKLKKHNITVKKIQENIYNIPNINLQGKLQDINKIYEYAKKLKCEKKLEEVMEWII